MNTTTTMNITIKFSFRMGMRGKPMLSLLRCLSCLLLSLFISSSAFGANDYWTGGASGDFTNAANWSTLSVPTAADTTYFTNNSTVTVAVNVAVTNSASFIDSSSGSLDMSIAPGASWVSINELSIGKTNGSSSALSLTNGGLTLANYAFYVGKNAGATGSVSLAGGQLVVTNFESSIGFSGKGTFNQSGGMVIFNSSAGSTVVGENTGSQGTLNLSGGTNLNQTLWVGYYGTGTVSVTGGQLVATNTQAHIGFFGNGTLNQSGGMVLLKNPIVGENTGSHGTLSLSGGTNLNVSSLIAGYSGTGSVLVTGGQLVVTNSFTYIGFFGNGVMTQSGGDTLLASGYVGEGAGSQGMLNLSGGTNQMLQSRIGDLTGSTGSVWVTGGLLLTANSGTIVGNSGIGSVTLSNGQWTAGAVTLGNAATGLGALNVDGGQVVATSVLAGGVAAASNNTVRVTHGGVLEANSLSITAGSFGNVISNSGGVYQFSTNAPTITPASGVIALNGGTISFRAITNADVKANWSGSQLTNVAFQGNNTFRLNAASNSTTAQDYTFGTGRGATNYVGLEMINGATAWRGGSLVIGSGGTLLVSNTAASIAGAMTNSGIMSVWNGSVVYSGNVVNQGAYLSDPSTNTFNGAFTVGPTATVVAAAGDIYALGGDFVMQSSNRLFNMSLAQALFATNGYGIATTTAGHTFNLTNSGAVDMGAVGLHAAQLATNFSMGTLSIALSNNLTVTGTKSGALTNALYVGWLDLSAWNTNAGTSLTTTLQAALNLPDINLYYDRSDSRNAYLQDANYQLWGNGGGMLIPIPEPFIFLNVVGGMALLAMLRPSVVEEWAGLGSAPQRTAGQPSLPKK